MKRASPSADRAPSAQESLERDDVDALDTPSIRRSREGWPQRGRSGNGGRARSRTTLASPAGDAVPAPEERLFACLRKLEATEAEAAATAVFGTFLGLLSSFIGEALVSQMLRGAFPAIDLGVALGVAKETK